MPEIILGQAKSISGVMKSVPKSKVKKKEYAQEFSPKVARLKGVIKLPENFDHKKEIANGLSSKYL